MPSWYTTYRNRRHTHPTYWWEMFSTQLGTWTRWTAGTGLQKIPCYSTKCYYMVLKSVCMCVCSLCATRIIGLISFSGCVTFWHIFEHMSTYKSARQCKYFYALKWWSYLCLCTLKWLTVPMFWRNILPSSSGWQLVQVDAADLSVVIQRKKCVGCIRWFKDVLPITATDSSQ